MLKEFKEFALKGNLVDMAIAFVMGVAFGKLVTAFVDGMVMPLVGLLTSGKDFSKLVWELKPGVKEVVDASGNISAQAVEAVAIRYGTFITVTIDFIIVALVMFMIIKGMNNMKKSQPTPPPPGPSNEEKLLIEIRDALKK